jgi:3-hydroxy acid dehydrogenase / malonic semialdehyde reductase
MTRLKGSTVLITGATSGIGKACAHAFAAEHTRLVLCGRNGDALDTVASALISQYDVAVHTLQFDVRDSEGVKASLTSLPQDFADVDVLINNAGLARGLDKLAEAEIADWEEMIDTNVKGVLYVTRTLLPGMIRRGRGHVMMLGSTAGHATYPGSSVYCATKHAVGAFTKALKKELHGTKIRVTSIDPGMVKTNFSVVRFRGDTERAEAVYRELEPMVAEDVAEIALFCASRPLRVNINNVIFTATDQLSPV